LIVYLSSIDCFYLGKKLWSEYEGLLIAIFE
jgi:hypothetical protein